MIHASVIKQADTLQAEYAASGALNYMKGQMFQQYGAALGNTNIEKIEKGKAKFEDFLPESDLVEYENIATVTEEKLNTNRVKEWQKYRDRYFPEKVTHFEEKEYQPEYEKFVEKALRPLAEAHAKWMESPEMLAHFTHQFDDENAENGVYYRTEVFNCIGNTQIWEVCSTLYEKWLSSPAATPGNLLMRALCSNQKEIFANEIKDAAQAMEEFMSALKEGGDPPEEGMFKVKLSGFDPKALKTITSLYGKLKKPILKAFSQGGNDTGKDDAIQQFLNAQVARILGPAARRIANPANVSRELMVLLGAVDDKIVISVAVRGSNVDMLNGLKHTLGGSDITGDKVMAQTVNRLMRGHATHLNASGAHVMYATLSVETVEKLIQHQNGSLTPEQTKKLGSEIAAQMRLNTLGDFDVATKGKALALNFKSELDEAKKKIKDANLATRREGRHIARNVKQINNAALTGVGLVFAVASLESAKKRIFGSNRTDMEIFEGQTRYFTGAFSAISSVAGAIDTVAADGRVAGRLKMARSFHVNFGNAIKTFGKYTGVAAVAVGMVWDVKDAYLAATKGEYGVMGAYSASAFIGGLSIYFLVAASASTGVGLALAGVAILLGYAISYFKDDSYQEWLKFSCFGKGSDGKGGGNMYSSDKENWEWCRIVEASNG